MKKNKSKINCKSRGDNKQSIKMHTVFQINYQNTQQL